MSNLSRNLAAIRKFLPTCAAAVEGAIVADFQPAQGTDGTPSYRRIVTGPESKKRIEWLGATSMPRASAQAIVSSLDASSGGANGLGLSIGTGYEWAAFIQRLNRAQMVYVYEPDPARLRMALETCELSDLLSPGRIVLLTGEPPAAAGALIEFLASHPGFDPPSVLHPLLSIDPSRRNELLAAGEHIVRQALAARQARVSQLSQQIASLLEHSTHGSERAATIAFLLTPRYAAERPIVYEAERLAAPVTYVDQHTSTSPALRLQVLARELERAAEEKRGVRVISDLFRQHLATVPAAIPVETWVPPLAGPGYWNRVPAPASPAAHDRIVAHFGYHAERLASRGIARNSIVLRPLVPLPTQRSAPPPELSLRHRVALIADLPASDAASLAIELPTHQAVFAAATELVSADFLTVHPESAPDLLRRALVRAGVDPHTQDAALQEPMLRIIRDVLIPALPPLVLAENLVRQGVPLTLIGDWTGLERHVPAALSAQHVRIIRFEDYATGHWQEVSVLAHLSPTGIVSPLLWDAIDAQVAVAAPDHPSDRQFGALAALLKAEVGIYARSAPPQFLATLRSLVRDASRRGKLSLAAKRPAAR